MPRIYLSPSTQDWNPYVDGSGSEEYWIPGLKVFLLSSLTRWLSR